MKFPGYFPDDASCVPLITDFLESRETWIVPESSGTSMGTVPNVGFARVQEISRRSRSEASEQWSLNERRV